MQRRAVACPASRARDGGEAESTVDPSLHRAADPRRNEYSAKHHEEPFGGWKRRKRHRGVRVAAELLDRAKDRLAKPVREGGGRHGDRHQGEQTDRLVSHHTSCDHEGVGRGHGPSALQMRRPAGVPSC